MKRTILTSIFTSIITVMTIASTATPVFAATPKNIITENQAKQIALENASLDESQVTFTRIGLDRDNGILEYEIDFNCGQLEYDYDIDAKTGAILSADKDIDDDYVAPEKKAAEKGKITEEKALEIALKDAGISKKDIIYSEIGMDHDDGITAYEVEFRAGRTEYNYNIAVNGGQILEHEVDIDD